MFYVICPRLLVGPFPTEIRAAQLCDRFEQSTCECVGDHTVIMAADDHGARRQQWQRWPAARLEWQRLHTHSFTGIVINLNGTAYRVAATGEDHRHHTMVFLLIPEPLWPGTIISALCATFDEVHQATCDG